MKYGPHFYVYFFLMLRQFITVCSSPRVSYLGRYMPGDVMISNYTQKNKRQDSLEDRTAWRTGHITKTS